MSLFDRPAVRASGFAALAFFVGLALGNGYKTGEALRGEAQWYRDWCGHKLAEHQEKDYEKYGR